MKISENLPKNKFLRTAMIGMMLLLSGCGAAGSNGNVAQQAAADNQRVVVEATEMVTDTQRVVAEATEMEATTTELSEATELPETTETVVTLPSTEVTLSLADIPEYSGAPYVTVNDNQPQFLETDLSTDSYEYYSDLDSLGRCGVVYACIGTDLMPTEERGSIGSVKPTGWHTVKYDVVDGNYLYNRCHLIGYQLSGENANTKNLITGTRYLNVDGMLPFENMVADYVLETENHVMYRVTPIFDGDNLLVSGVQIEAESVEDNGEGILFNVYCYNVQPGVEIDYATGDSQLAESATASESSTTTDNSTVSENTTTDNSTTVPESTATDNSATLTGTTTDNSTVSESTVTDNNAAVSDSAGSGSVLVWKSATGSKYHSINNCGNMNPDKATQITEEQAINGGLGKCSKCW